MIKDIYEELSIGKVIRKARVLEVTGRSYSSIYRDEKAGRFPARIRLGPNSVGWYEHEVQDWVQTRERVRQ